MRTLGLSFLVVAMACGGGGSGDSWPSASSISDQSFTGALGDGSVLTLFVGSGTVVAPGNLVAAPVTGATATATILIRTGGTASLTGSYDPATGELSLSGGDWVVSGTYSRGSITGTVTAPSDVTYGFVLAIGDTSSVTVYCGDWANTTSPTIKNGAFMLMISGGHAWGVAGTPDGPALFSGSASETHISMTIKANGRSISGTISGADISGTFQTGSGGTGTWSGSSSSCPTGAPE